MQLDKQVKQKRSLGALRKANKTKPKSPDLTGQMKLQRHTAAAIVDQFSHADIEEVVCNIAGWKNLVLLRVSDAGSWRRCGLHRGRRPKAFNERNRDGRRLVVRLALWEFECRG